MVDFLKVCHILGVYLLSFSKSGGVLELTAIQSLFNRAHDFCQWLAVGSSQFNRVIIELHNMGITIVGNPFIWFRRYYDADAIVTPIVVKSRNMGIMVCKANGYNLSILCFKRGIFTTAAKTLCTKCFRYIAYKSFRIIRLFFILFLCLFKII